MKHLSGMNRRQMRLRVMMKESDLMNQLIKLIIIISVIVVPSNPLLGPVKCHSRQKSPG